MANPRKLASGSARWVSTQMIGRIIGLSLMAGALLLLVGLASWPGPAPGSIRGDAQIEAKPDQALVTQSRPRLRFGGGRTFTWGATAAQQPGQSCANVYGYAADCTGYVAELEVRKFDTWQRYQVWGRSINVVGHVWLIDGQQQGLFVGLEVIRFE